MERREMTRMASHHFQLAYLALQPSREDRDIFGEILAKSHCTAFVVVYRGRVLWVKRPEPPPARKGKTEVLGLGAVA